jgi:hypothetical protein
LLTLQIFSFTKQGLEFTPIVLRGPRLSKIRIIFKLF